MAIQYSNSIPRADLSEAIWEYNQGLSKFIGLQALPALPVDERSATLAVVTRESMLKREADSKRAPGGAYARIDQYAEDMTYKTQEYGLEGSLDDSRRREYQSMFDVAEALGQSLWLKLMIDHEIRVKEALFNTSTWTGDSLFTDKSSAPWSTAATDIIGQVADAQEKVFVNSGVMPNTLIVGGETFHNMISNDDIVKRFPGAPAVTKELITSTLAAVLGIERILVGDQIYDSAKEGQSFSGARIWSKTYAMVARISDGAPAMSPSVGRTVLWTEDSPVPVVAEQYREDQTRSDVLRVRQNVEEKIIDKNFAHLIQVEA